MPRFYDEANPALNSFRKINAEVVKRRKKKYANQAQALVPQGVQDPKDLALYEGFTARISSVYTAVTEIYNTLALQNLRGGRDVVIDRFVASSVNAGKLTRELQDYYFRKMNRSFNKFTPSEVDSCAKYATETHGELININEQLDDMSARARGRILEFVNEIEETIDRNFGNDLDDLLELITDGLISYKQGLGGEGQPMGAGRKKVIKCGGQSQTHTAEKYLASNHQFNALPFPRLNDQLRPPITTLPFPKPIGMPNPFHNITEIPDARFFRKIGGAELYSHEPVMKGGQGVAYRVGLQFSNPFTKLGPYPPRNTQDLKDLPRRFL
jgi:hypothetical protein